MAATTNLALDMATPKQQLHSTTPLTSGSSPVVANAASSSSNNNNNQPQQQAQLSVSDYVQQHHIHVLLDKMVKDILVEKPSDCDAWMLRWFLEQHRLSCARKHHTASMASLNQDSSALAADASEEAARVSREESDSVVVMAENEDEDVEDEGESHESGGQ